VSLLFEGIEAYLDAAPRSAADPEEVGKFTIFRPRGPWPFYARPRLGLDEEIGAADVEAVRQRQRELKVPENFEWVTETTPSLEDAARATGLKVVRYPLMVLDRAAFVAPALPKGLLIRYIDATDLDFASAHAVANVGFSVGGTDVGPEGALHREAAALASPPHIQEFMRERARRGLSVSAAIFDREGPLAVGTHQPVNGVTEVVGVATLPSARRRGLGAAVTAALVEEAWSRGVETVFLSAGSDDVARVYARIGFRQIGFAGSAESPAADAREGSAPREERIDVDADAG